MSDMPVVIDGPIPGRCNARTRGGGYCKTYPMANGKCYKHGGPTPPPGPAHPNWKHGRHSKVLEGHRLGPAYERTIQDPNRLALDSNMALLDAREDELIQALVAGDDASIILEEAREIHGMMRDAMNRKDFAEARVLMAQVSEILDGQPDQEKIWTKILVIQDRRRRLAIAERQRLVAMDQLISPEVLIAQVRTLQAIIRKHVPDAAALAAIQRDIEAHIISERNS